MGNSRFSILQARAVEDKRISNSQFRTLAALGMYGDKNGWCFPKLKTIGDMLGKSKQAVHKDLMELAALGYVEIYHQTREDGGNSSNKYRLIFDPVNATFTGSKQEVDTPSTPEVDTPSTPEVDALTTHINAPLESIKLKKEVGFVQKFTGVTHVPIENIDACNELERMELEYPDTFWDALEWASQTTPPPSSAMRYVKMLGTALPKWRSKPKQETAQQKQSETISIVLPDGTLAEVHV